MLSCRSHGRRTACIVFVIASIALAHDTYGRGISGYAAKAYCPVAHVRHCPAKFCDLGSTEIVSPQFHPEIQLPSPSPTAMAGNTIVCGRALRHGTFLVQSRHRVKRFRSARMDIRGSDPYRSVMLGGTSNLHWFFRSRFDSCLPLHCPQLSSRLRRRPLPLSCPERTLNPGHISSFIALRK